MLAPNWTRKIRERFHPLFYARKSSIGRFAIRVMDQPAWLSIPAVRFKVRGRLVTHGLAFAMTGSQEPNEEALVVECMRQLDIRSFWDIGANIGHYAWLAKSVSPDMELVLFEPLPANAMLIRDTLNRHRFSKAVLIAACASDSSGTGTLLANSLAGATSTLEQTQNRTFEERHWGVAAKSLSIPLVTIDEERAHHGPVDFMKIDVEGHEKSVLAGASKTIASDQPVLFIECFHAGHLCLDILEEHGYRLVSADHLTEDCSENTSNYFCFPQRFSSSIDSLLRGAREGAKQGLA